MTYKLHQFITTLFWINIPTYGRVQYNVKKNLTPSWSTGVTEIFLPLQYYTCTEAPGLGK